MVRHFVFIFGFLLAGVVPAHTGGKAAYSVTDALGTVERVLERRNLPDGLLGATVSYTRKDGSRSVVEYGIRCSPLAFAYLGMTEDRLPQVPNLLTVRKNSDRLLNDDKPPPAMIPLAGDTPEKPIKKLSQAVCAS